MRISMRPALLAAIVLIICSCKDENDPGLPDLAAPEFTYFQINGEDVHDDTIHLPREEPFNLRFDVRDNVSVLEGDFSLIINNLEELSDTINKGPGQRNYKFTYGLLNLATFDHLKDGNSYTTKPNDQIKFTVHAVDPSTNFVVKSIVIIVF